MNRAWLLLIPAVLLPLAREDRRNDDRDRDEPRVILYQHADFRGEALVLHPGEVIENLSGRNFPNGSPLNDSVSSIRIEGGAEIYIYEHAWFHGQAARLTESVRDLTLRRLPDNPGASWNDQISSLKVELSHRHPGDRAVDFDGVIRRAYKDLLSREPDTQGLRYYHVMMIDHGWTEAMVRDHLRQTEEFRREAADRIVRRAYQDLLGREPDESGLRHFREMIMEHKWSETDVRDNIRRSPEYLKRSQPRR